MIAWIILGVLALIIFLIACIPVGADIAFEQGELTVSAKACGVLIKLFPKAPAPPETEEQREKRQKREEKRRQKQAKKDAKKAEKAARKAARTGNKGDKQGKNSPGKKKGLPLDLTLEELLSIVKKVFHGLGKFHRLQVDRFKLDLVVGGSDPYVTAKTFGTVNAFLSALGPVCNESFHVKECEVRTDVDFMSEELQVDFGLALSIRIGQIFGVLNSIVSGVLGVLIRNRVRVIKHRLWLKYTAAGKAEAAQIAAEEAEAARLAAEKEAAEMAPITRSSLEEAKTKAEKE